MSTTVEINTLYNNLTYHDIVGNDITISYLLIFVLLIIIAYFYIISHLKTIRQNWKHERCNPFYMPFAGWIAAPKNTSWWKYTETNFNFCLSEILKDVFDAATYVVKLAEKGILDVEKGIIEAINELFILLGYIEKLLMKLLQSLYNKIENIFIESTKIAYAANDILDRNQGIMSVIMYTINSIWNSVGSINDIIWTIIVDFFKTLFFIVDVILDIGLGLIIIFPAAIITYLIGLLLNFIFSTMGVFVSWIGPMNQLIFNNNPASFPNSYNPIHQMKRAIHCFHELTPIPLEYKHIPIYKLEPGMKLMNGQLITTTLILDSKDETMYNLDHTIVSGTHPVYYNNAWIKVANHPQAILVGVQKEPIYCLNTQNKLIKLKSTLFSDWDDIEEKDLVTINAKIPKHMSIQCLEQIHSTLESALHPDTPIELNNGAILPLYKIKLNDQLKGGIIVTGVVKSLNQNLLLYPHKINNIEFIGTHNISYITDNSISCQLQKQLSSNIAQSKQLYSGKYLNHIITDKGYFYLKNIMIKDYYYGMEQFFI
tara:strand:- start:3480 stop:5102 length:1623 start_codon:yes stop_codon:yes gene_type:complete